MLTSPLATIFGALIAFVGTVLGLMVAYRRWTKERDSARYARFDSDQQDIYKTLWQKVEDVNVALRRDRVDESGFGQLVADLNEFMLRNGAHLEDSDIGLVNRYTKAAKHFDEEVRGAGAESQIPYGATQEIPREVLQHEVGLGAAEHEATRLRNELRRRVRVVLAGKS